MSFPPDFLDEVRARLAVSDVVGRRVKLRRQGREFAGLSPFKTEKTPSFTVNDAKGFYHCFASGEHGDIFTFLMKTEGLTFPEAVERLAGEAGLAMPARAPRDAPRETEAGRLRALTEASAAFFEAQLRAPGGRDALAYLARRGLGEAELAQFRIGYAPAGRAALKNHLAALGFSAADAALAGMLIAGDGIPQPYDRFRDRVIFPIADPRGSVTAFGGRALRPDQQPKYLNSPETPLFHKGATLYNFAAARRAAHDTGGLYVAEGYMDVIALARAGHANAVAPLGTALTADQLGLLWRVVDEPVLCFDGDAAGRKAAWRALDVALPLLVPGKSLSFVLLPDGCDPDDLLQAGGPAALGTALAQRTWLIDLLWRREFEAGDWSTPERRAWLEQRCETVAAGIADRAVRANYASALRDRLRRAFAPVRQPFRPDTRKPGRTPQHQPLAQRSSSLTGSRLAASAEAGLPLREALLLGALLVHPWLVDELSESLASSRFSAAATPLRDATLRGATLNADGPAVRALLDAAGHGELVVHVDAVLRRASDRRLRPDASRADVIVAMRELLTLQRAAHGLTLDIAAAEASFAADGSERSFLSLCDLIGERESTLRIKNDDADTSP